MTADPYPRPATAPLALDPGTPSGPLPFTEHADVDPVTGRTLMHLAVARTGPPGALTIRVRAGQGPPVDLVDGGKPVGIRRSGTGPPVAVATRTSDGPGLHLVVLEILSAGSTWTVEFVNGGTAGPCALTWVIADDEAGTRRPWIDAADPEPFAVDAGATQTRDVVVTNHGTGPLALTDPDGLDLGQGFRLDTVTPRSVPPAGSAVATVSFTAPGAAGTADSGWTVAGDDHSPDSGPGHRRQVRLTAVVRATAREVVRLDLAEYGSTVRFAPDGGRLAVLGKVFHGALFAASVVRVVDPRTGAPFWAATTENDVDDVVWSPDGQLLAATGYEWITMYDGASGAVRWNRQVGVLGLPATFGGGRVATGSTTLAAVHDAAGGGLVRELVTGGQGADQIRSVRLAPDGLSFAVGLGEPQSDVTGRVRLIDASTGGVRWEAVRPRGVRALASDAAWSVVVGLDTATGTGSAAILGAADGAVRAVLGPYYGGHRVRCTDDGTLVAVRDVGGRSHTYDAATGARLVTFDRISPVTGAGALDPSTDGRRLLIDAGLDQVRVVDPRSGAVLATLTHVVAPPSSSTASDLQGATLSPDGRLVATVGRTQAAVFEVPDP